MNWLRRTMYGRYARMDQFNIFLAGVFIVFTLITGVMSIFLRRANAILFIQAGHVVFGSIYLALRVIEYVALILFVIRFMSRNIQKQTEMNRKFMRVWHPVAARLTFLKNKSNERKQGRDLFMCPQCKKQVRVPRGRGRIEITCPACRHKFVRKT